MNFKLITCKLKQTKSEWHKYLLGKTLILLTGLGDTYNLVKIEGEKDLSKLCEFAWDTETEHEYFNLAYFIEEVELANDGFGFTLDQIEVIATKVIIGN